MRQKIQNKVTLSVEGIDLTTLTHLEVFVSQNNTFECKYIPTVIDKENMYITIPYEQAMLLTVGKVEMQFSWVDSNNVPDSTDAFFVDVKKLINPEGYNPS